MKAIDVDELWKRIHDTDMGDAVPGVNAETCLRTSMQRIYTSRPDSWLKESLSPKLTG